jgi:hypothetical protein
MDGRDRPLFDPRSLGSNSICAGGAKYIGEVLKKNTILTSLKCAPASPCHSCQMCSLCCQQGALTVCGCSLFDPRSLDRNRIGATGAMHIGEALKINKTLTSLTCAPPCPTPVKCVALLSAVGR